MSGTGELEGALKGKTIRQVIPADIERYIAGEVKPASVNRELHFLKHVFNVAIGDRAADTNPVRAVKLRRRTTSGCAS